ncbi:MAG: general secretion pathway protein GspK [Akkermansiaceae bacterium]|jgi:general secretion pathway protein K|nr:general secretion pathway protein GspK [Akkermansiaceae bacterium]MBJ7284161.1 general secretion pathway protein GspK [Akkermansiaceae bacterium]MBJ7394720.1 general secretion pathway protein GspK [Akkermansiaceae bacterium]MBJ7423319.1 general secretion pathway protein GspK [Akkermansiaceae bacterium]
MRLSRSNIQKSRGAALMAVLWLIAILAMACMATLRVISFDMELASAKVHGSRARQVAEMGIAVGSNPVVKRSDPILHYEDGGAGEGYDAKVISEGGRFNINAIILQDDKALLKSMFMDWGLELEAAQEVADALTDWIDSDDDEQLNGAEKTYYEGEGRINQPFNRPFYDVNEVALVRGMDLVEALRPDWREWFTIWSGGGLDLNEAPAELIAAAAEIPVEQAIIIPETVRGTDGERDTLDDVPFENAADALDLLGIDAESRPDIAKRFTLNDATTRVESTGFAEGAKRKITVILRNRAGKPALLERTEEIIP